MILGLEEHEFFLFANIGIPNFSSGTILGPILTMKEVYTSTAAASILLLKYWAHLLLGDKQWYLSFVAPLPP